MTVSKAMGRQFSSGSFEGLRNPTKKDLAGQRAASKREYIKAFQEAIVSRDPKMISELVGLLKTAGCRAFDINGWHVGQNTTILHLAVMYGSLEVVMVLLEAPYLQVNTPDKFGKTPYCLAQEFENVEIVNALVEAGASRI